MPPHKAFYRYFKPNGNEPIEESLMKSQSWVGGYVGLVSSSYFADQFIVSS